MRIILVAVLFFFLFISFWGFYISIRPPKIISGINPKDLGLDYEQVTFTTIDNIKIVGWWIPTKMAEAKTVVLLHGYPADKGDILPALAFLNKKYNLLLFDFRYFGESEGKYSSAGAKEVEDLMAAIKFLRDRQINEVGVWGFSLGGAVALMTAPKIPEIKAIISVSSYASLDLMAKELYRLPLLKYPLSHLTLLWAKLFLAINARSVAPMEAVKNLNIPILLIHSTNDEVIPFTHAKLLQEALKNNQKAEFWFQENLVHGQLGDPLRSRESEASEYQKRIEDFFEKNL